MFGKIGQAMVRRPWLVIVGWLLGAAVLAVLSPGLGSVTTSDQAAFLPDSAESARAARLAAAAFPGQDGTTAVVVVHRVDGVPLTEFDIGTVGGLVERLGDARPPAVAGVDFDPARQVSPDRRVALAPVRFAGSPDRADVQDAVRSLRAETAAVLDRTNLTAGLTGQAAITVDNARAFADAERIVLVATLALILLLLLVIFRSPVAALLPLVAVGVAYLVSSALVALGAAGLDIEVGRELPTMLTVVLFGIGTDYVLFLLFRYRERRRAGDPPAEAVAAAVERVGEAISSAAFAVIAAFGALVLAVLGFFTTLGPALAVSVAVMLVAALTLVPALVTVLGRWTFWPARQALAQRPGLGRGWAGRGWAGLGRFVAHRPIVVVAGSVALLGALAAGALQFRPEYDPIAQLPAGTEARAAFDDLRRGFPAGALQPTTVYLSADRSLGEAELTAFAGALAQIDGIASPLAPQVAGDGRTAAVPLVLRAGPYSREALDLVGGPLREAARAAAPPGTTVLVGGPSMAFADVRAATNRDLRVIFPIAAGLFVLILAGLLRAVLAPIYLTAMVVAGFAAALGATTWTFAGPAFSIPIILYLFVTAIGTDYNILITARLREEMREGRSVRESVALAVAFAGPAVAAAALILAGTFAALLISGVPFLAQVGFAVSLGIVLVAFVVSILLVPAVTALAGRVAWWPGRDARAREKRKKLVQAGRLAG